MAVVLEGMLWKEALLGSWIRYHFTLEPGLIRYFDESQAEKYDADRGKPRGSASLGGSTVGNTKSVRPGKFALRLDLRDRGRHFKWVLGAATPAEAADARLQLKSV